MRVLLRGGRRGAEPCIAVGVCAGGEGVGDTMASSLDGMLAYVIGVGSDEVGDMEGAVELAPPSINVRKGS